MLKRRKLTAGQQVIIIYDKEIGYVKYFATLLEYRSTPIGETLHEFPIFQYNNKEISGLDCFWILPTDIKKESDIEALQKELIPLQITMSQLSKEKGYIVPTKIQDNDIESIATTNDNKMKSLIKKLGFDPRDDSWIETTIAETDREKKWFKFERENAIVFTHKWDDIIENFNKQYNEHISVEEAKSLSKKRMRYILGAYHIRMSGNGIVDDWKRSAKEFEKFHLDRENRMLTWTLMNQQAFPLVKTKKPVQFWPGPYFHECIENIPHLFTSSQCRYLKAEIVLRVISYDPEQKFIRLDFTEDVRKLIKKNEIEIKPWIKDRADYDIWIKPEEIDTHLDFLDNFI